MTTIRSFCRCVGVQSGRHFGPSFYPIELKSLERIVRGIAGVELSQRSLVTVTSALENVAGATSLPSPRPARRESNIETS
jgi:hypothetical protein